MELNEILIENEDGICSKEICYNCQHSECGGGTTGICMGPTPWKGEELQFNNTCIEFKFIC